MNVEGLLTKDIFKLSLVSPRSAATIELKMHESELNEEVVGQYTLPAAGIRCGCSPAWSEVRCVAPVRPDAQPGAALDDLGRRQGDCTVDRTFRAVRVSQCVNALIVYPYERPRRGWSSTRTMSRNSEMFAGYVEEENPEIEADYGAQASGGRLPSGFNGYQSGDEITCFSKDVRDLVRFAANWGQLQQCDPNSGQAEDVRVQNVRF